MISQSVPAEELRRIQEELCENARTSATVSADLAYTHAANLIGSITPAKPTLADLTPDERKSCEYMQAEVDNQTIPVPIIKVWEGRGAAEFLLPGGGSGQRVFSLITPRPDLPKLKWPEG